MGHIVNVDLRKGGGVAANFMTGSIEVEPTAMHTSGTALVLPDLVKVPITNGTATLDLDPSPAGEDPAWGYKVTIRSNSGRAWAEYVSVPDAAGPTAYTTLERLTASPAAPPLTTWGEIVAEANAAKVAAEDSATAAAASAGLVGAPAGAAVLAAVSEGGAARGELIAAIDEAVAPLVSGPVRSVFARLDMRDPAALVVAGAGDSTTDSAGEYLETGLKETAATLYPERPAGVRRYDKTNETLLAYSQWQDGSTSAPGQTDATLLSDTFTRTAAALVGTSPDVGPAWVGSTAGFSVNGSRAVFASSSGVGASLQIPSRVGLKVALSLTVRLAFNLGSNTQTRVMLTTSGTSGSADRIDINISGTTTTTTVLRKVIGGTTTTLATFPAGTIPDSSVAADYPVSLSVDASGVVTATVNGQTVTATLDGTAISALSGTLYAGFYSSNTAFEADNLTVTGDTASTSIPSTLSGLTLYNGGYAGGRAEHQTARLDAMYPVKPDLLFICHGHNYATVDTTPALFLAAIDAFVDAFHTKWPGVPVVFVSQNPEKVSEGSRTADQVAGHLARQLAMRGHCVEKGWSYVPAMEAFAALNDGGLSLINTDGVHVGAATSDTANKTGGRIMADALKGWMRGQSYRPQ